MSKRQLVPMFFLVSMSSIMLTSCAQYSASDQPVWTEHHDEATYAARLPQQVSMGHEKVIIVDPNNYAWGAYDKNGKLVKAGIATAGGSSCEDETGPCYTAAGTFRIQSMGGEDCYSKKYPRPNGGGLMPYCMFFHGGQALHGSPDSIVVENNISHGCVRMRIPDAEWLRYNFANVGTKVVVKPYH